MQFHSFHEWICFGCYFVKQALLMSVLPDESEQQCGIQLEARQTTNKQPPKATKNKSQQTHVTEIWDTQNAQGRRLHHYVW